MRRAHGGIKKVFGGTRLALLLTLLGLLGASPLVRGQSTEVLPKPSGEARVLVVGGPGKAFREALAAGERPLRVETIGAAGTSLRSLREDASVMETVRGGGWDLVVLTGHPTFGKTFLIDGEARVGDPSELLHHGRLLVEEVRRAGGRPVLLVPPRSPGAPAVDQQAIDWAYTRLGQEAGAILAPAGDAFARVRRRRPDLALFDAYGESWSPAGAELAAAVVEATLTGRPPASAPAQADGGGEDGSSAEARRLLNAEAWAAVRELAATGGYREVPPPPFPSVPILARGNAVGLAELRGAWRGPLRLYPWPATLDLEVTPGPEGLRVAGRVRFEGGRPALAFEAADAAFEQGVLSFRNPSDLAKGRTLYRLVARGDCLAGMAELLTEDGAAYAVGGLELERARPAAARLSSELREP